MALGSRTVIPKDLPRTLVARSHPKRLQAAREEVAPASISPTVIPDVSRPPSPVGTPGCTNSGELEGDRISTGADGSDLASEAAEKPPSSPTDFAELEEMDPRVPVQPAHPPPASVLAQALAKAQNESSSLRFK
eukprot:15340718-Alexandrium_andersonii.AAC.1